MKTKLYLLAGSFFTLFGLTSCEVFDELNAGPYRTFYGGFSESPRTPVRSSGYSNTGTCPYGTHQSGNLQDYPQ